jgi:hypothetical protein
MSYPLSKFYIPLATVEKMLRSVAQADSRFAGSLLRRTLLRLTATMHPAGYYFFKSLSGKAWKSPTTSKTNPDFHATLMGSARDATCRPPQLRSGHQMRCPLIGGGSFWLAIGEENCSPHLQGEILPELWASSHDSMATGAVVCPAQSSLRRRRSYDAGCPLANLSEEPPSVA